MADKIIVNSLEFKKEIKNKFNINSTCIYNPLNKKEIFIKSKIKTKKIYSNKKSLKIRTLTKPDPQLCITSACAKRYSINALRVS